MVERSSEGSYPPGTLLRTCSAEDLIILKAFAGRGQDWVDIENIIIRQVGKLDWDHIHRYLEPLVHAKGEPAILEELNRRRVELEG